MALTGWDQQMIRIKQGLDLPIPGRPDPNLLEEKQVHTVAVLGSDFVGLMPAMAVKVGDRVLKGQTLFTDKRRPAVRCTAPGTGEVIAIHRGRKRALVAVVIALAGNEEIEFRAYPEHRLSTLKPEIIIEQLLQSGLWTALRTRPYSKVADPAVPPHSIFITAMDTNPLAPAIDRILAGNERDFSHGVRLIARLTSGKVFLCKGPELRIPEMDVDNLVVEEFQGPHPAGNVGTHIHFLDPVHRNKIVWHIGLQDVIAVGRLFTTGRLSVDRIVSLAGPSVQRPRLLRTRIGALIEDLVKGEIAEGEHRVVSGSVLSGHRCSGPTAFLGRYHQQISVLPEYREREFLGWLNPGLNLYSVKNIVLSKLIPGREFAFTTSTHGEERAILPNYDYERVMPLDILPLFLLRALAVGDVEEAENLGCLELDEEDLALCAFVCPSKQEFGPLLRRVLHLIESGG